MRVADFVIKFLEDKGIKNVFTVSGGGSIFLCDALYKSKKLNYVSCHHEQAVSFATESYSRVKNKPGAAIITTGPGGTNCTTGVACCWIDSVPSIFISGQVYLNQTIKNTGLRQLGVQEFDIVSMVKTSTKYSVIIQTPESIKYHLEKAYYLSMEGRPGPVWVDIPANIQNAIINPKKLVGYKIKKKKLIHNQINLKIKKVAKLLSQSKRPILHLGHGVKISRGEEYLRKIIKKYKIPFALTWNASDLIESSHPYYIGRPGAFAERGTNFIIQNCDLYISVGTRLPYMVTGYDAKDYARKAIKVVVDIDKNEIKRYQREFYPDWIKGNRLSFETTPIYLFREKVPELIKLYAPSSRCIILLRQPELRALSHWKMNRFRLGIENRPFHEVVNDKDSEYVQRGLYAKQILRYLDFFDKQRICIVDSSALLNNPDEMLRRIEQFLGVKQGLSPSIKAHVGVKTEEKFTDELNALRDYYKPYNEELKGLLKAEFELTMSWLVEDS